MSLKTGELAELTGVAVNTIRAYEQAGLIRCHKTRTGQRRFAPETVARVRRIRELREMQLSLPEIKTMLLESELILPDLQQRRETILARISDIGRQRLKLEDEERQLRLHLEMLDQPGRMRQDF